MNQKKLVKRILKNLLKKNPDLVGDIKTLIKDEKIIDKDLIGEQENEQEPNRDMESK